MKALAKGKLEPDGIANKQAVSLQIGGGARTAAVESGRSSA